MTITWARLLAVVAGATLAVQPLINARLRSGLGDPFFAALLSFLVGAVALFVITLCVHGIPHDLARSATSVPWWAWTGGLFGAAYVTIALTAVPRIGSAALLGLVVFGLMATAISLDAVGAFGTPVHPLTPWRALGALCVAGGAALILFR